MRKGLAGQSGQRKKFKATFARIGKKKNYQGYSEDTLLFSDVIDLSTGKIVTDHIWFNYTKGFEEAGLKPGASVEFEARVKEYTKGYVNSSYRINKSKKDFKLSNPTKIRVIQYPESRI